MFKIISAEIKKMLAKPGVYVLAVFLAIILVLGAFVYKPQVYESTAITLEGNTFMEKYDSFYHNGSASEGPKAKADSSIKDTSVLFEPYTVADANFTNNYSNFESKIKYWQDELSSAVKDYNELQYSPEPSGVTITNYRNRVVDALKQLKSAVDDGVNYSKDGSFVILISKDAYTTFTSTINDAIRWMSASVTADKIADLCFGYNNIYGNTLNNILNNLKFPTLSKEVVKTYTENEEGTRLNTIQTRLNTIFGKITDLRKEINEDFDKNLQQKYITEIDKLANLYINTANDYSSLVKYELLTNAFSYLNTNEQINVLYPSNESAYNAKTSLIKYNYLFEHNEIDEQYAHPLTIGVTSNHDINAYDYAYFSLKLFSFVIIAYAVMAACHSIAGEIKEGSMRYYAIRPVTRTEIYFGKLLAIILMSTIFIIFSSIIAVAVGGAVYGFGSLNILTIFNSTTVVTFHPIVMIVIYMISLLLELIVYTTIAMLLSCLFKSDLLAITLILLLYLVNSILPVFATGVNSWLTYYPFSHISLYALFGSSIYAVNNNFVNLLLGAKIYTSSSIILTASIILAITLILNIITIFRFKKKEL